MANYATLKAAIQSVITTNGNNEITGAILQQTLLSIIDSLGADYQFVGIANPSTNPGTPDQRVAYLAGPGTYSNFNSLSISDGQLGILKWNNSWSVETVSVGKDYDLALKEKVNVKPGKNLFNIDDLTNGLLAGTTGLPVASTSYKITGFIPVVGGTTLNFSRKNSTSFPGGSNYVCFYDENFNYIPSSSVIPSGTSFSVPSNASYMRVPIYGNYATVANEPQIEIGTSRTEYESYSPIGGYPFTVGNNNIPDNTIGVEKLKQTQLDDAPTSGSGNLVKSGGVFSALLKNRGLVNGNFFIYSSYACRYDGQKYGADQERYLATDLLPLDGISEIIIVGGSSSLTSGSPIASTIVPYMFYDANKTFISAYSGTRTSDNIYTVNNFPANAKFIRCGGNTDYGTPYIVAFTFRAIFGYLAQKLSFTESQNLTDEQKQIGRQNLGISSAVQGTQYGGVADENTTPDIAAGKFYLANTPGIYTGFGNIGIETSESALLFYDGSNWQKQKISRLPRKKLYVEQDIDLLASNWSLSVNSAVQNVNGKLRITCQTGGDTYHLISFPLPSTIDVSNSWFGIDFDTIDGSDDSAMNKIDSVALCLSTYDSFSAGNWYSRNAVFPIMINAQHIGYVGNYKTSVNLDIQFGNRTLSIDKTNIKSIGILIRTKAATDTPTIQINRLFSYRKPGEAQVVIGFDNIYNTQINALNYLKTNGFRGTLFFGAASVGGSGRFTLSELKSLQADGHLMASYGRLYPENAGDPINWYSMTLAQKISAIRSQVEYHYKNGFGRGARLLSTPAGGYAADESILWESGLVTLITGRINYANDGRPLGYYGPYTQGHSCGPSASNNDNGVSCGRFSVIDAIVNSGGFAIFIFHNVAGAAEQDITLAEFQSFVDYVKTKSDAGLLNVITADELSQYELSEPNI